jgi:hypothetical protein
MVFAISAMPMLMELLEKIGIKFLDLHRYNPKQGRLF